MNELTEGTAIVATVWGKRREGQIVENRGNGVVWVRFNDTGKMQWLHSNSIERA